MTNTTNRMFFAEMEEIFFVFQLRKSSIIFYSSSFIEITNDKVLSFFTLLQLCNSFTRLSKHSTTFMTNSFLQNRLDHSIFVLMRKRKTTSFLLTVLSNNYDDAVHLYVFFVSLQIKIGFREYQANYLHKCDIYGRNIFFGVEMKFSLFYW